MGLIAQSEALAILKPHIAALKSLPFEAWAEYHGEIPGSILLKFCPRTRASGIHNLMISAATKYAAVSSGVRIFESQMMRGITVNNRLAIRFKKLDEDNRSRNQPSKQVRAFRNQKQLDGIAALHNLELGYVLNDSETEVVEARLVHPSGKGVYWWTTLGDEGQAGGTIELFPTPPKPHDPPKPPKIGPKKKDNIIPLRKAKQKDDEN
jgi:hypothetical protein